VSDGRWAGCGRGGEGRGGSAARHQRGAALDRAPVGRSFTEWPSLALSGPRALLVPSARGFKISSFLNCACPCQMGVRVPLDCCNMDVHLFVRSRRAHINRLLAPSTCARRDPPSQPAVRGSVGRDLRFVLEAPWLLAEVRPVYEQHGWPAHPGLHQGRESCHDSHPRLLSDVACA
jgi:hypothetical protein